MIDDTNLADYADPVIYDLENSHFEPDGPFFLSLARPADGPVLELGCGHLAPGGRFVIEAIFPHPRLLATVEEEQAWFSYEDDWDFGSLTEESRTMVYVCEKRE